MNKVHFVAIGGQGMSGIARILIEQGFEVSGSDMKSSSTTDGLRKLGARVCIGHSRENIIDPDVVVVSSAISEDNPEVLEAKRRGIPIVHRMDMLLWAAGDKKLVTVAGAHGKTTTSSMIAWVMEEAGVDPTYLVGGQIGDRGNAKLGNGPYAVVETDESDGSFLKAKGDISVVTNVDKDHLDYWGSFESLKDAFRSYLENTSCGGKNIVCTDNEFLRGWIKDHPDAVSYAVENDAIWRVKDVSADGWGSTCLVEREGEVVSKMRLGIPGLYNIQNALGAIAAVNGIGIQADDACRHLESFPGVKRRLERIGEFGGVLVIDDFAHHPREIEAALDAVKDTLPGSRLIVIFQPHRYSRTRLLHDEFGPAFRKADALIITEIYVGPGENEDPQTKAQVITEAVRSFGNQCVFQIDEMVEAARTAASLARQGDVIMTMGAGDIWRVHDVLRRLLD
ncbi:MAG TPA: UDP-N-acetylmuramate--L-alanine ligase [Bacillota bacterium]|nr:UDP-N-acetylmuramate--L-alanine ligase [Bacillota bacterium]